MRTKRSVVPYLLQALGILALTASTTASAGALITYGQTTLGINDQGHLNFFSETGPDSSSGGFNYGLYRAGLGDAISPGCLCEGWGVSAALGAETFASWASVDNGGIGGLGGGTFGATSNTATSVVDSSVMPMTIRHAFGPSLTADLFQVQVTLTNTSASETLFDLTYRRAMDWDVPPTEFREFVTHGGVTANLIGNGGNLKYASDDGFAFVDPTSTPNPINFDTVNTDFYRNGPADHGSVFDFSFGSLAPGASRIFNIYYGSAATEVEALAKVNQVGASVYSFGNSAPDLFDDGGEGGGDGEGGGEFPTLAATASDEPPPAPVNTSINPTTFIFAFGGVSGVEPGTIPELPVLPFMPAPGVFTFDAPTPQRWFDPPSVDGFTYRLEGGTFIAVGTPPESFGFDSVTLYIDGVAVSELDAGDIFDFLLAGYTDITTFDLRGISPLVDPTNPVAFPTYLDFTAGATGLSMTAIAAVPEPEQWAMMMFGLLFILAVSRRAARMNIRG